MNRIAAMQYRSAGLLAVLLLLPIFGAAQRKGPGNWTTKDLRQAISNAKTPADHRKIAQYYVHDAERLEAQAKDHAEVGQTYHEHAPRRAAQAEAYCRMLADQYTQMAQKERQLAKLHEEMTN